MDRLNRLLQQFLLRNFGGVSKHGVIIASCPRGTHHLLRTRFNVRANPCVTIMQSLLLHLSHLGSVPPLHGVVLPIGSSCCLPVDIVTCLLFVIQDMHEGDMLCACFGIHASGVQHHCQLSDVQYNHLDASDMTQITISSHHLLKSGLSVSPFLVCWDTWLCWSPPPWWAQHPFPAEYGSL
jgi:hypothetical protein